MKIYLKVTFTLVLALIGIQVQANEIELKAKIQELANRVLVVVPDSAAELGTLREVKNLIHRSFLILNGEKGGNLGRSLFSAQDARACQKLGTTKSEGLCLKNRVKAEISVACGLLVPSTSEEICLTSNSRPGSNRAREMTGEDIKTCGTFATVEGTNTCLAYRVPAELTRACQAFSSRDSELLCLMAN